MNKYAKGWKDCLSYEDYKPYGVVRENKESTVGSALCLGSLGAFIWLALVVNYIYSF